MTPTPAHTAVERLLRAHGIRPTRHRLALASILFDGRDRHITAEGLHQEAHAARVPVALATVYNTLNQLRSAGLLREVVVEPGRAWFDTRVGAHAHIFNETTGELIDAEPIAVPAVALPPDTDLARIDVIVRVRNRPTA